MHIKRAFRDKNQKYVDDLVNEFNACMLPVAVGKIDDMGFHLTFIDAEPQKCSGAEYFVQLLRAADFIWSFNSTTKLVANLKGVNFYDK